MVRYRGSSNHLLTCKLLYERSLQLLLIVRLTTISKESSITSDFSELSIATGIDGSSSADDIKKWKVDQLCHYLRCVFPRVYDTQRSIWSSMYDELITYHPYITIFNWRDGNSMREKLTSGVYLLTVQSMLMFLMAVFMDLEV